MVDFLDSLAEQVQNRWCALSTDDIVLGGLIAAGSGVGLPALGIAGVVGVARKSSDQICSKSAASPAYVPPPPPFTGGQCVGVPYSVTVDLFNANGTLAVADLTYGSTNPSNSAYMLGAISSVTQVISGGFVRLVVVASNRTFTTALTSNLTREIGNIRVVALSGSGSCGDPPSVIEPITEYPDVLDNVPFDDENGNPVNFPDLPIKWFPPCITLEGIKLPFEIETPLGNICGQLIAKPDVKTGIRPKVDFDLCPSERQVLEPAIPEKMKDYFELSDEIGSIVSPFPSSDFGGIPSLQADSEKPIMGVFLECGTDGTVKGKATKIFNLDDNSDAPTLFIPRLGYVRFWMLAEGEESDAVQWSLPIEIKQPKAFIACPSPFGALAVDVQMNEGYQAKYKVAKRKTCCEACEKFDPNAPNDALDRCD